MCEIYRSSFLDSSTGRAVHGWLLHDNHPFHWNQIPVLFLFEQTFASPQAIDIVVRRVDASSLTGHAVSDGDVWVCDV